MQNPFLVSLGFKNPILDFLKETHPQLRQCDHVKTTPCIGYYAWLNANTVTRLQEVADSAAETDNEEFSYPARLDFILDC